MFDISDWMEKAALWNAGTGGGNPDSWSAVDAAGHGWMPVAAFLAFFAVCSCLMFAYTFMEKGYTRVHVAICCVGALASFMAFVGFFGIMIQDSLNNPDAPEKPATFAEMVEKRTGVTGLQCATTVYDSHYYGYGYGYNGQRRVYLDSTKLPSYNLLQCSFTTADGDFVTDGTMRIDEAGKRMGLFLPDGMPVEKTDGDK